MTLFKSSRSQVFYKIGIFKNFTIFTAKHEHLCWNLFLIKLQLWRPATWLKENFNIGIFLRNFKSSFFIEHLWCLFLINDCEHLLFWISNQQACLIIVKWWNFLVYYKGVELSFHVHNLFTIWIVLLNSGITWWIIWLQETYLTFANAFFYEIRWAMFNLSGLMFFHGEEPYNIEVSLVFRGGSWTAATSKMERFVVLLSQSAPSWMLQQS